MWSVDGGYQGQGGCVSAQDQREDPTPEAAATADDARRQSHTVRGAHGQGEPQFLVEYALESVCDVVCMAPHQCSPRDTHTHTHTHTRERMRQLFGNRAIGDLTRSSHDAACWWTTCYERLASRPPSFSPSPHRYWRARCRSIGLASRNHGVGVICRSRCWSIPRYSRLPRS